MCVGRAPLSGAVGVSAPEGWLPPLAHFLRGETESHLGCFVGHLTPNLWGAILPWVPCCPGVKGNIAGGLFAAAGFAPA